MLTLKRGSAGLSNLIDYMLEMLDSTVADEDFLVFARSIVAEAPYDNYNQLMAVLAFVRARVHYQPDPDGTELFTSPRRMMELVKTGAAFGDCDDIAIFQTAICRALGYSASIVLLDQSGNGYNHAATEVVSDSLHKSFFMDATWSDRLGVASSRMTDEPGSTIDGLVPHYRQKMVVG